MKSLIAKLIDKFKYAFQGLFDGLKKDSSIQLQWLIAMIVILVSCFFPLNKMEWIMIILICFIIIALEYFNSALEALVDLASPAYHPLAKQCKDYAAAGVLVAAILAIVIAIFIYYPYIKEIIGGII